MAAAEVFVLAKEPRPGLVKTRLCPPLAPAQAARCQRAFTRDTVSRLAAFASQAGARLSLAAAPHGDSPWLQGLAAQAGVGLVWQGPGDLGRRMERLLARSADGSAAVVLIGADSPDVPMAYLHKALLALENTQAVLGPASDGGYYLIGCRGAPPPVFDLEARWGSSEVLGETVARLRGWGRPFAMLPTWWDVDDWQGLRALARRIAIAANSDAVRAEAGAVSLTPECRETRAVLAELAEEGVEL